MPLLAYAGPDGEPKWTAVNDAVMGGASQAAPRIDQGMLRFSGSLSLANNGGFASTRTRAFEGERGGMTAFHRRVRGDRRSYQLRLSTESRCRGSRVSYGAGFATEAGQLIDARIPMQRQLPRWRGRTWSAGRWILRKSKGFDC